MNRKKSQNLKRIVSGLLSLTMITSMSAVLPASAEEESTQGTEHHSLVETPSVLNSKGDVNSDGKVNTADRELLNKWLVRLVVDNELDMENADVNMDGKVDIMDLVELSKLCKPESGSSDEETFEQHIGEDSEIFSEINTEDNAFKVSLDITASDDVTASLSASESEYSSIIESDMVVGVVPEFECEEGTTVEDVALNFKVEESFTENTNGNYAAVSEDFEGIKRFNVFKYFDDIGMLLPVETTYDTENNRVTTHVDELGTYCLVDMEQWFENLGIAPEEFATVNVSPSPVGMAGISVRAAALASAPNTVTTPIDVVFHPYAKNNADQDKIEASIKDTATSLFNEYGRNGNVRVFVSNYRGSLAITDQRINYAENEEELQQILNKISCVPSSLSKNDLKYQGHLRELMTNYNNSMRTTADRYYVFIEKAEIRIDATETVITNILDQNNMTAVMISSATYDNVIKNTGGIRIEDKFEFSADVSDFILGKRCYKTLVPTGWKKIELAKPITNEYKIVLDDYTQADNFDFTDREKFADTDEDGLIDLREIRYSFNNEDIIKWDSNGNVILPTIKECRALKAGKTYVDNALSEYGFWDMKKVNDIRILPVWTDPTDKDTDHDDFEDSIDPNPMNFNKITIDDKLLDDSGSIEGTNPVITQDDLDKMIDPDLVRKQKIKVDIRDNHLDCCLKNALAFIRTRKCGISDAKFTLTPSRNSDYAFTITGTNETKFGEGYTTKDYNSTVKISYNKGKKKVDPVEIRPSDDGTQITYVFSLEQDIKYNISVNNPTNNHEGEYELHVSQDNWVYAPKGAFLDYSAEGSIYTNVVFYLSDSTVKGIIQNYWSSKGDNYTVGDFNNKTEKQNIEACEEYAEIFYDAFAGLSNEDLSLIGTIDTAAGLLCMIPVAPEITGPCGVALTLHGAYITALSIKEGFDKKKIADALYKGKYNIKMAITSYYRIDPPSYQKIYEYDIDWAEWDNKNKGYISRYAEPKTLFQDVLSPYRIKEIVPLEIYAPHKDENGEWIVSVVENETGEWIPND